MRLRREIKIACGVLYADVHWLKKGLLIHNINIKVRKLLKRTSWQKRNFILHFDGKYDNVLDICILLSDKKKFDWQIPNRFLSANLFTFCHIIWQALFTFFKTNSTDFTVKKLQNSCPWDWNVWRIFLWINFCSNFYIYWQRQIYQLNWFC